MTKVHLDLRATSFIPEAYKLSSGEISQMSGANLGNLVFRHALKMLIDGLDEYTPANYKELHELSSRSQIEQVIVSCANWLGTREADENSNKNRANAVEAVEAPMCCFGLGVQAEHGATRIDLGPESQRLARALAEKARLLSVRDELTADTLRRIGISNTVVTGCPSNFINTDPLLGERIQSRCTAAASENPDWSGLRGCISEFSGGHVDAPALMRIIISVLNESPSFYVVQSPVLMPFLLNEIDEIPPLYAKNSGRDVNEVRSILLGSGLAFSSVDSWLDFSRTCKYSFGMRIHGTVVPIQAGVPSLLVAHDSRTAGLADVMGIPAIEPKEFAKCYKEEPKYFFETVSEKMSSYDERRASSAEVMRAYLVTNGLLPTAELNALAVASMHGS